MGVDHVPKVLRHFLPKCWELQALKKLPHSCPKWADTKVTSQCPKRKGGGEAEAFFCDVFPKHKSQG